MVGMIPKKIRFNVSKSKLEAIAIAFLLWAILPVNPYVFYMLLKLVICGIAIALALRCREQAKDQWMWVFIGIALLYNPIIHLPFVRFLWTIINIATIVAFWKFARRSQNLGGN
jgi:hypothetical protein